MVVQTSLFDIPVRSTARAEQQARAEGMAFAEGAAGDKGYDIEAMRRFARWFCHANESRKRIGMDNVVWADIIREKFEIRPLAGHGNNFMGSLFLRDFEPTGERIKSKTLGGHGNDIRLWRLKTRAAL